MKIPVHRFTFILLIFLSIPSMATAQTVTIPDANLRAAIAAELDKASGATITTSDMAALTWLSATNSNISDLTGLEHAINLTWLFLGSNSISDITSLSGLTNLTQLSLGNNSILDLSSLSGLTKLTRLSLDWNSISDITSLSGLTNLTSLSLGSNSISDITSLSGLTNLIRLSLDWNSISDITSLSGLTSLTSLYLNRNSISDITLLSGLTNLTELYLNRNSISDITSLGGLTSLTSLDLWDNSISDITSLGGLTSLTSLDLWDNSISDITSLGGLTSLTLLRLSGNSISTITSLSGLTNLTRLYLGNNSISDLSVLVTNIGLGSGVTVGVRGNPLSSTSIDTHIPVLQSRGVWIYFDDIVAGVVEFPDSNLRAAIEEALDKASGDTITTSDMAALTWLYAANSNISDSTGLEHAINLTYLSLSSNSISDLSSLAGLTNLTQLSLSDNSISDLSSVSGLTNLRSLDLGNNAISDITSLSGLTNLTELDLWGNSISDLSTLVTNEGLGSGDTVGVRGNPLSSTSIDTHIPVLQSRGVTVNFDDIVAGVVVELPDANLRAVIEEALGKTSGDTITTSDMAALTRLSAGSSNISDLTGLEHAINLTWLNLGNNSISDISSLAELTNLSSLNLSSNSILDIASLSGLTNLTWLNLSSSSISDITSLAGLTKLNSLNLSSNSILDIASLSGLTNLTWLNLWNNSISDLSALLTNTGLGSKDKVNVKGNPLSSVSIDTHIPALQSRGVTVNFDDIVAGVVVEFPDPNLRAAIETELGKASGDPITTSDMTLLTHLESNSSNIIDLTGLGHAINLTELSLWNTSISDISLLGGLTNLARLSLRGSSISEISSLSGLTNLTRLSLNGSSISDISSLAELTNLASLSLDSNSISDITSLAVLTSLTSLSLNGNSISDISSLSGLTNLRSLSLWGNSISDISSLSGLTNLRSLSLNGNSISDISPLSGLTNLTSLSLSSNSISDISSLGGLTNLTELSFSSNSISDISSLGGLTNLSSLNLSSNSISDISSLGGLTNLTELWLRDNSISDLSALVANTGLGSGDTVNVTVNPLSTVSIDTHIPALQSRGTTVRFDDIVAGVVEFPDVNLRVVIEEELGKASGDTITTSDMAALTRLRLGGRNSNISDLAGLEHAINLTRLYLGGTSISDISSLARLTKLTFLSISGTSVLDITSLSGLTSLIDLFLVNNSISDITLLSRLTNLRLLSLDGNLISDIASLLGLTNLTQLSLRRNSISDITLLSRLTNLTLLNLDSNSILDLSPLVSNTGLRSGDTVNVGDNPLNYASINTHIPTLQSRGVTVGFDDRTPTRLVKISGDNQKEAAFTPLPHPFVVEVQDERGKPFAGVSVVFTVAEGGGTLSLTHTTTDVHGRTESTLTLGPNLGTNTVSVSATEIERVETFNAISDTLPTEYRLSIPVGISLIHVPLKVTEVDGVEQTITSIADLYDAIGGASTVNFLITYDSPTQEWRSYFVPSDQGTLADVPLADDTGIIAGLRTPVSVDLSGDPLGIDGNSTITLNQGLNLVGLPLRDSRVTRVSGLFALDGIGGNVPVIILTDGGEFKVVGRPDDPGDVPVTGGQSFILTAQRPARIDISGGGWYNSSTIAAAPPPMVRSGIQVTDTTPVMALRGSIVDEGTGVSKAGFRVKVKNLSTDGALSTVTGDEGNGYQLTVVDIETTRAARIGDILEISAQSPNPFIGVEPLRYTVTAEDVKQSLIQLPNLVAYEIPAETELLANYPNPFNPETWIPYRLAEDAFVTLTIYDGTGHVVRTLEVGHRIAAVYEGWSKAIYWDGRNEIGEQVASGVYFYHLSAGDYSATRKMVIVK